MTHKVAAIEALTQVEQGYDRMSLRMLHYESIVETHRHVPFAERMSTAVEDVKREVIISGALTIGTAGVGACVRWIYGVAYGARV